MARGHGTRAPRGREWGPKDGKLHSAPRNPEHRFLLIARYCVVLRRRSRLGDDERARPAVPQQLDWQAVLQSADKALQTGTAAEEADRAARQERRRGAALPRSRDGRETDQQAGGISDARHSVAHLHPVVRAVAAARFDLDEYDLVPHADLGRMGVLPIESATKAMRFLRATCFRSLPRACRVFEM